LQPPFDALHDVHGTARAEVRTVERPLHSSPIMLPRRILCSIDVSAGSEHAQRVATRLATEADVPLELVEAAERILGVAEPTDLIVMGAHRRTALRLVRHARCSVLVVDPVAEPRSYCNILVAVDFSACSRRALEQAADLASRSGAAVTVLHVIELPVVYGQDADLHSSGALDDWSDLVEAQTRSHVTRLVRTGSPAPEVLSTAAEDPSLDLIVVGSHGRRGLERMLLGSVAENVVRHATRPVMVAR
jgi:nucleotide-binding universal stress UspA family protein